MDDFPEEIICIVYTLLPPIYRVTFALAYPRVSRITTAKSRDIRQIIHKRCPFANIVVRNGGVLTGGFLLDCLFGTNFASDIDIIFDIGIRNDKYWTDSVDNEVVTPKMELFAKFRDEFFEIGARTSDIISRIASEKDEIFCSVRKYVLNDMKIDTIFCEPGIQVYISQYDFDFCKVYFDGKLKMLKPINVIKKESVEHKDRTGTMIEYVGFTLPEDKYYRQIERKDKYTARGFKIIPDQ